MKRTVALVLVGLGLGLVVVRPPARAVSELRALATQRPEAWPAGGAYRDREVIVAFRGGVDERSASAALRSVGGREARRGAVGRHLRVALDGDISVPEAVRRLAALAEVEYAEPNGLVRKHQGSSFTPNDRFFVAQWNMRLIGAPRTWAIQQGKPEVGVAVLDSGIAFENFGPYRKAPDWGSVPFLQGFDAVNGDTHANDDEFHGTHVSSTVAEAANNNLGMTGLAFGISLMPVKVLDENGEGTNFDVAEGIDYVTAFRSSGSNPVKVINLSLGGPGNSETVRRAVDRAVEAGILVVASSGNESRGTVEFPAGLDNVVAVGATDGRKQRAPYSNYGTALDLVAPGGDGDRDDDSDGFPDVVFQQMPDPDFLFTGRYDVFCYCGIEGTSMAAPHVAAAAALLFSQGIGDARSVRAALEQYADDLGATGRDDQFGHGLINPAKALSGLGLNQ
jgi:serine protease